MIKLIRIILWMIVVLPFSGALSETQGTADYATGNDPWIDTRAYVSLQEAVHAAKSTGKQLWITQNHVIKSAVVISVPVKIMNGAMFIKSGSGTLSFNGALEAGPHRLFTGFKPGDVTFGSGAVKEVLPEWWGAQPGGETDCRLALQSAIESISSPAASLNGGMIRFGRGVYLISDSIQISASGVSLAGAGSGSKILPVEKKQGGYVTKIMFTGTGALFNVGNTNQLVSGIIIKDMRIAMPNAVGTTTGVRFFTETHDNLIENVVFTGPAAPNDAEINDASRWAGTGVRFGDKAQLSSVRDCGFYYLAFGVWGSGGVNDNLTIFQNIFRRNTYGVYIGDDSSSAHYTWTLNIIYNMFVMNNTAVSVSQAVRSTNIEGNYIELQVNTVNNGVYPQAIGIIVGGNKSYAPAGVRITGNILSGNYNHYGIQLLDGIEIIISDNIHLNFGSAFVFNPQVDRHKAERIEIMRNVRMGSTKHSDVSSAINVFSYTQSGSSIIRYSNDLHDSASAWRVKGDTTDRLRIFGGGGLGWGDGKNDVDVQLDRLQANVLAVNTHLLAGSGFLEASKILTSSRGTILLDDAAAQYHITLTENVTKIKFPTAYQGKMITLVFTQSSAGNKTVSGWPGNVLIAGGSFVLSPNPNKTDVLKFQWDDTLKKWLEYTRSQNL